MRTRHGSGFPWVLITLVAAVAAFLGHGQIGQWVNQASIGHASHASPVAHHAIAFARKQIGKPYLWGGTGPNAFDCSGLVMQAYRSAGVSLPRTSQDQWAKGHKVPADQVEPGDLVYFAGSDGTRLAPGHVGIVIGGGKMVEAYATGFPIRIARYAGRDPVGFTRPAGGGS